MTESKTTPDIHLKNLIRRCREELQDNKPVQAAMWLADIERHLLKKGIIAHD